MRPDQQLLREFNDMRVTRQPRPRTSLTFRRKIASRSSWPGFVGAAIEVESSRNATVSIAGSGGGTEDKPVGLVYIAVATKHTEVLERRFGGDRERVRHWSTQQALNLVRRRLMESGRLLMARC